MGDLLAELAPILAEREDRFVLVSMAAGLAIGDIQAMAGGDYPVLRIMPNTPCSIGEGMILYTSGPGVRPDEERAFLEAMAGAGRFSPIPEKLMDAGSAVAGCGPAFVDLFLEALADGGVACGLPRAQALEFAAQLVRGKVFAIAAQEFAAAEKAGLSKILADRKSAAKPAGEEEVKAPPAEPCTASIPGIEVMDLEDAAKALWKAGIYAETGMGCTGPLVMMSEANHAKAQEILKAAGYIG